MGACKMKASLLLFATLVSLISCSTEEVDDLPFAEQLAGNYTLSVLVESVTEDVGGPDDTFYSNRA